MRSQLALAPLLVVVLTCTQAARAHQDVEVRLEAVSRQIRETPADARLYLRRGELHRLHRAWARAEADYTTALGLDPQLGAARLALGTMLLEAGRPAEAIAPLDVFLAQAPRHAEGLLARARARMATGDATRAADDFGAALVALPSPRPEHVLEHARALAACTPPRLDEAVRALEDGLTRLGPVIALRLELEQLRGHGP